MKIIYYSRNQRIIVCSYKKERRCLEMGMTKHLQSPKNIIISYTSVGQKQNSIIDFFFLNRNQGTVSCLRINRFLPNRIKDQYLWTFSWRDNCSFFFSSLMNLEQWPWSFWAEKWSKLKRGSRDTEIIYLWYLLLWLL